MEEEHNEEELSTEDVAYEAHHKVDALIDLLIKKNVISDEEFSEQIEKLVEEMEGDEEDDDDGCEEVKDGCCGEKSEGCCEEKPEQQGCCGV